MHSLRIIPKTWHILRMDPTEAVWSSVAVASAIQVTSKTCIPSALQAVPYFCDLLIWWFEALLGASDFFFEIAVPFSAGLGLDAWLSPNSSIGVCQTSNCLPCSIMGASLCIIQHRSSSFSHPTNDMSSAHCRWGIWNSYFNRRCRRAISKEGRCCFPDFWLIPRKNVCHKWS